MYDDSFKIRYSYAPIAISETKNQSETRPHIHSEIEFLYILEGNSTIKTGIKSFEAQVGLPPTEYAKLIHNNLSINQ